MMKFKPVELNDRDIINSYLEKQENLSSEYTFSTFYIWRKILNIEFAEECGCLIVKFKDNGNPASLRFPLGDGGKKCAVVMACDYFNDIGEVPKFYGLTTNAVDELNSLFPSKFEISEMVDYSDYVYKTERLINLSGKKLHSKKNHVNSFKKSYDYKYSNITKDDAEFIINEYANWFTTDDPYLLAEQESIGELLRNFDNLQLKGAKITVGGSLCAFTIGEKLNKNTAVVHIEKANTDYKGSYSMINQMFAENELSNFEYINREEDCGIEGLRKAKQSYHPDLMIKKYKAVLKGDLKQ